VRIGLIAYGDIETMTGGFLYDRMFVRYLREQGDTIEVTSVPWRSYGRRSNVKIQSNSMGSLMEFL
jgi:hypothetical protein